MLWQRARAPGAAEKMFQVAGEVLDVISAVAGWPSVGRRSAARLIGWATAQLGAPKTKEAASEALLKVCEACEPAWVVAQVRTAATKQTNPKVLQEAVAWAAAAFRVSRKA